MIIPKLGFGTGYSNSVITTNLCLDALSLGYRHIDTAQGYNNEEGVGKAIKLTEVKRSDIFLTTKIRVENYTYDKVILSCEESLDKLQTDYVDQLMLHRPRDIRLHHELLDAMMKLKSDGKIRNISVSNFPTFELEDAINYTNKGILSNQIEKHVYLNQNKLSKYCNQEDIQIIAYAPLCRGDVFKDIKLKQIAEKHNVGIAQVALRWLIQKDGVSTLTGGLERIYLEENRKALEFQLDNDDIKIIEKLPKNKRYYGGKTVQNAPNWDD